MVLCTMDNKRLNKRSTMITANSPMIREYVRILKNEEVGN
jgi:hypothetical protein